jgi:hypothetical protein
MTLGSWFFCFVLGFAFFAIKKKSYMLIQNSLLFLPQPPECWDDRYASPYLSSSEASWSSG